MLSLISSLEILLFSFFLHGSGLVGAFLYGGS
jgi:hypothetical protein